MEELKPCKGNLPMHCNIECNLMNKYKGILFLPMKTLPDILFHLFLSNFLRWYFCEYGHRFTKKCVLTVKTMLTLNVINRFKISQEYFYMKQNFSFSTKIVLCGSVVTIYPAQITISSSNSKLFPVKLLYLLTPCVGKRAYR